MQPNDYCQPGYCQQPGHPAEHDEKGPDMLPETDLPDDYLCNYCHDEPSEGTYLFKTTTGRQYTLSLCPTCAEQSGRRP